MGNHENICSILMLSSCPLEADFQFIVPFFQSIADIALITLWAWSDSDNAGNAVINAAETGAPFPLKRRDVLLDYILTLMGRDDDDGFADYNELLRTQVYKIMLNDLCLRWSHLWI